MPITKHLTSNTPAARRSKSRGIRRCVAVSASCRSRYSLPALSPRYRARSPSLVFLIGVLAFMSWPGCCSRARFCFNPSLAFDTSFAHDERPKDWVRRSGVGMGFSRSIPTSVTTSATWAARSAVLFLHHSATFIPTSSLAGDRSSLRSCNWRSPAWCPVRRQTQEKDSLTAPVHSAMSAASGRRRSSPSALSRELLRVGVLAVLGYCACPMPVAREGHFCWFSAVHPAPHPRRCSHRGWCCSGASSTSTPSSTPHCYSASSNSSSLRSSRVVLLRNRPPAIHRDPGNACGSSPARRGCTVGWLFVYVQLA